MELSGWLEEIPRVPGKEGLQEELAPKVSRFMTGWFFREAQDPSQSP